MSIRQYRVSFLVTLMGVFSLLASISYAQKCPPCGFANNNTNNRISIFSIDPNVGSLMLLDTVPTGGVGANSGHFAIPQIAATASIDGQGCLFATNAVTNNVSAFVYSNVYPNCICTLDRVEGSPFSTRGVFGNLGGGVALSPDGGFLYTSNPGSNNVSTFLVNQDCSLTLMGVTNLMSTPDDIQVNADGTCMAVASPNTNVVYTFDVSKGIPQRAGIFDVPGLGRATGVEFSSLIQTPRLYVTKEQPQQTVVTSFIVSPNCRLVNNPAVTIARGVSSSDAKLTPDEDCLFVPNQITGTVTTFSVDPVTGNLALVGTFGGVPPRPAATAFFNSMAGLVFYTSTVSPRQVVWRLVNGCVPDPETHVIGTGVPGRGFLRGFIVTP